MFCDKLCVFFIRETVCLETSGFKCNQSRYGIFISNTRKSLEFRLASLFSHYLIMMSLRNQKIICVDHTKSRRVHARDEESSEGGG